MDVRILAVPWDAGHHQRRMGRGPGALLRAGVADRLRALGHDVDVETVAPHPTYLSNAGHPTEVATSFSLWRSLSERVAEACGDARTPVVLTGNCGAALGVMGGLADCAAGTERLPVGVVWMDAHGDFHTPDTSASGFLDGMSLSIMVGRCWRGMSLVTPGFAVPERDVLHLGGRDLDPAERGLMDASTLTRIDVPGLRTWGPLREALDRLAASVGSIYLHVDLDVLDPREAPANAFVLPHPHEQQPGDGDGTMDEDDGDADEPEGLTADELVAIVGHVASSIPVDAVTLSAYDPAADPEARIPPIAFRVLEAALGASA
jgi:arginase